MEKSPVHPHTSCPAMLNGFQNIYCGHNQLLDKHEIAANLIMLYISHLTARYYIAFILKYLSLRRVFHVDL
jgi:hypothetical protein